MNTSRAVSNMPCSRIFPRRQSPLRLRSSRLFNASNRDRLEGGLFNESILIGEARKLFRHSTCQIPPQWQCAAISRHSTGSVDASNCRGPQFRMASALVKALATVAVARCACSSKVPPRRATQQTDLTARVGPGPRRLFVSSPSNALRGVTDSRRLPRQAVYFLDLGG
jgi:hypothetical protein